MLTNKRILILRYDGNPFHVRMSKEIETLQSLGYEVDILTKEGGLGNTNVSKEFGRDISKKCNVYFFKKESRLKKIFFVEGIESKSMKREIRKLLSLYRYDYILVKDTLPLKIVFNIMEKLSMTIPVVCTMYENSYWMYYEYFRRFGSLLNKIIAATSLLYSKIEFVERTYLKKCSDIIVVVEEAKNYLIDTYNISSDKISVVHNVERVSDFESVEFNKKDTMCLISYVGSTGRHRGLELFIEALAAMGEIDYKTVIVGASRRREYELRKLSKKYNIENKITIYGYLKHKEALGWIKKSDIGVIPHIKSKFIETTVPNKLFQYMLAGSCIVASDVGPLKRIVEEEDCGVNFRAGDIISFSSALRQMINNKTIRIEKGMKGKQACINKYNWERESQIYSKIFAVD